MACGVNECMNRKTRLQHRELHALLFSNTVFNVPLLDMTVNVQETGPPVYRPYPRRLERLTWSIKPFADVIGGGDRGSELPTSHTLQSRFPLLCAFPIAKYCAKLTLQKFCHFSLLPPPWISRPGLPLFYLLPPLFSRLPTPLLPGSPPPPCPPNSLHRQL